MAIDLFSIGRFTVHGYGLMVGLGFIAAVLVGSYLAGRRGLSDGDFVNMGMCVLIFGYMGGKLMYIVAEAGIGMLFTDPWGVLSSEGFVVYGGIITGFLAILIYCKVKKLDFLQYGDLFAVSVPLNQSLGRIGCLLAGCCYGRPTDSRFSLVFPEGAIAPAGVRLIPTQPIMAAGDMLIFVILLILYLRCCPAKSGGETIPAKTVYVPGIALSLYLIMYSVGRFAIEYLRDDYRGWVGPLSTSQFVSIFTFAAGLAFLAVLTKKRRSTYDSGGIA